MSAANWLRLIMILAGMLILWMTLLSLARRKFTDGFSMLWGILSICMILGGILLSPHEIGNIISNTGLLIALVAGFGMLSMAWGFSWEISALQRKNHELAMQVSLLNQEMEEARQKRVENEQRISEEETMREMRSVRVG